MFSDALLTQLAQELDHSEKSRQQIEHFSKRYPGMGIDDGYRVAREWVRMQIAAGRKVIALYSQFKMYNDPALNPELYSRR